MFSILHHEKTRESYEKVMSHWAEKTIPDTGHRCATCWLRTTQCRCAFLRERLPIYASHISEVQSNQPFTVLMYYHFSEIGRSPNTAHIFPIMCPALSETVIYGNTDEERKLIDEIVEEYRSGKRRTAILYPCPNAVLVSEWVAMGKSDITTTNPEKVVGDHDDQSCGVRFVVLDGTYHQAARQMKHLEKALSLFDVPVPAVKLHLDEKGCKSAIAGIMYQPAKEKICSFQAVVMAMQQTGMVQQWFCDQLLDDLHCWLAYILKIRVKLGKARVRNDVQGVDTTPNDEVVQYLEKHPPPTGNMKPKGNRLTSPHFTTFDGSNAVRNWAPAPASMQSHQLVEIEYDKWNEWYASRQDHQAVYWTETHSLDAKVKLVPTCKYSVLCVGE